MLAQQHSVKIDVIEPNVEILPPELISDKIKKVTVSNADLHVILVDHKDFYSYEFNVDVTLDFRGVLAKK